MAIVTEVREFKGTIDLALDGVHWLKLRKKHFSRLPLEAGDSVDPEEYVDRMAALQAADCYEAALTLLDQAAQARNELCKKLVRRGYVLPAAEATVARLAENRLIDDQRYAERLAQNQLNRGAGAYAVRRKLRAKLLSEEDIEAAMADFDGEQQAAACREAAGRLWRKYAALPPREGRAKLSQALARRGFGWDAVRSAVDALSDDSGFDEDC